MINEGQTKDDLRQIKRKASSLYNLSGYQLNNDVACILRLDTNSSNDKID